MHTDFCDKHPWERANNECRHCRHDFCTTCLVYAEGPDRPPLCLSCALALSGIRKHVNSRPRRSWWEARKRRKLAAPVAEPAPSFAHLDGDEVPTWAVLDEHAWVADETA